METHCIICGHKFVRRKTNKKTCSAKCRNQLARYRTQVDDIYWRLKADVETYEKMLTIPELEESARAKLEAIMVKIYRVLE